MLFIGPYRVLSGDAGLEGDSFKFREVAHRYVDDCLLQPVERLEMGDDGPACVEQQIPAETTFSG